MAFMTIEEAKYILKVHPDNGFNFKKGKKLLSPEAPFDQPSYINCDFYS